MTKTPRKSPRPGRDAGSNGPTRDDTLEALAAEILDQEAMSLVRDRRKRNRTAYESKGGTLPELDLLYKKRDDSPSEIESYFRRQWGTLTAFFTDLADQLDLFTPKATREAKAAFSHGGLMAALKGEPATPPPNLEADEMNEWMDGHNRGSIARAGAQKNLADTLAEALKTADAGGVVDGTGGPRRNAAAVAVGAQAKADFEKDNPPATFGDQIKEAVKAEDPFEAPPEELSAQKERKIVEAAKPGAEAATDPLIVNGETYKTLAQANAARKKLEAKPSQSVQAAAKRKAAGV